MKRSLIALGIVSAALICVFAIRLERSWAKDDPANPQEALVPHLKEWKYPGARLGTSGFGSGGGSNGRVRTETRTSNAVMYTKDDVKTVVAYYLKKANFPRPKADPKNAGDLDLAEVNKDGVGGGSWNVIDDSADRPVTLRVMFKHTQNSSLMLLISRAEGEKETHIVLSWKETEN